MGAVSGCGDGSEPEDPTVAADQLCAEYRDAVSIVRYGSGDREWLTRDFKRLQEAATAAQEGTDVEALGESAREYTTTLGGLASAYGDVLAAIEDGTDRAYYQALDLARPFDQRLDEQAGALGFESCALGEPSPDERLLNQPEGHSGTPAMYVPADARLLRSPEFALSLALDPRGMEQLALIRGPSPAHLPHIHEDRQRFEREFGADFDRFEEIGGSANRFVDSVEYGYEDRRVSGSMHLFSGFGHMWALDCRSHRAAGPSSELARACERAIGTTGFLIF